MQSVEQCGGDLVDLADDAYDWNSSKTTVATLPTKTLHTVAGGSATGNATVYVQADKPAPRCPIAYYSPEQPVTVASPNQVEPIATASQGVAACSPSSWSGWIRNVTNQVQYANGSAFAFSSFFRWDLRSQLEVGITIGSGTSTGRCDDYRGWEFPGYLFRVFFGVSRKHG